MKQESICHIIIDMYFITMERMWLKIGYAKAVPCPPDWQWDSLGQGWSGLHLWAMAKGVGHFTTPVSEHRLSRGECFILRPPERYIGTHDPKRPLTVLTSTFRFIAPSGEEWNPPLETLPRHRSIKDFSFFGELARHYIEAWERRKDDSDPEPHAWLKVILYEYGRLPESPSPPPDMEIRVSELVRLMKEKPGSWMKLDDIAQSLGRSKNQALRLFKEHTGSTPGKIAQSSRLEEARSLLVYSSLSIKEIAGRLGYSDQFFFSRQFKSHFGVPPSAFRIKSAS